MPYGGELCTDLTGPRIAPRANSRQASHQLGGFWVDPKTDNMQSLAPPTDRHFNPRDEADTKIGSGLRGLGYTTQLIVVSQGHEINPIDLRTLDKSRRRQRPIRIKRVTVQIRINGMRIAGQILVHGDPKNDSIKRATASGWS
jgi:hypothetical protein